jgi:hypothetical protein
MFVKAAWVVLAAVHLSPALVLIRPQLMQSLYGLKPEGSLAVLMTHRGALFLVLVVAALFAAFDPGARRVVALSCTISLLAFLLLYAQAGFPSALKTIAVVDLVALAPLLLVTVDAWRA